MFRPSIDIAAEPGVLFDLTQDYARRLDWDLFLKEAKPLDGAEGPGVGVRAWCVARNGLGMETEYVSFNPPRTTAVKMTRGPWFIDRFAGSWRFEEAAPGQTQVGFRYSLRAWPLCLSWLLTPLLVWVFVRDTRKRLVALKKAVEEARILTSRTNNATGCPSQQPG